jgi:predicted O-linked N-acetylglucosamine transferase (SPINDLY family)
LDSDLDNALSLHKSGRLRDAEAAYRRIAAQQPNQPEVQHLLGILTAQTNRFDEAYRFLRRSEELRPGNSEVRCDLGRVAAITGRLAEAEDWLRQILSSEPANHMALVTLANVLHRTARYADAAACANTALRLAPNRPEVMGLLAAIYSDQGNFAKAERIARQGLAAAPRNVEIHTILGSVLRVQGKRDEAVRTLKRGQGLLPAGSIDPMLLFNLGMCHYDERDYKNAETCFAQILARAPDNEHANAALGEIKIAQSHIAEGRRLLDRAIACNDRNWLARWSRLLAFPIIYENQAQLEETRADFDRELAALEADTLSWLRTDLPNILRGAQYKTDFLLHYHGRNDVALQRRFGGLITRIAEAAYPAYAMPIARRKREPGEPIRVGFASAHFYSHSVAKTHGAWITELPRDRFSVSLFHLLPQADETTERLKQNATYHACGTLSQEELVARIAAERLDILIWLDIGMEARAQIPSALRLAPVQATTWGHPVTSGLPNIDYYLSSDRMEPSDADDHYSERLVRLPNLSIAYPRPPARAGTLPMPVGKRKADGQILFLCAQSLFKLLPEHDDIFPAIARAVPDAAFLFIAHKENYATQIFSERLNRAFAAAGLSAGNRVSIVPRLSQEDFFALNREADVVLDSIGWAGCNSTLEALACDKPVVTLAGETMRARHGLAILGMIGMTELIARDKAHYVEIATRLGRDFAWRQEITTRIAARKDALYGDRTPLDAFAAWLESAAADGVE